MSLIFCVPKLAPRNSLRGLSLGLRLQAQPKWQAFWLAKFLVEGFQRETYQTLVLSINTSAPQYGISGRCRKIHWAITSFNYVQLSFFLV